MLLFYFPKFTPENFFMNLHKDTDNKKISSEPAKVSPVIPMNFSETISPEKRRIYDELLGNHPFRSIKLSPVLPLDKSFNRFYKRAADLTFSFLLLVLLFSWLLPLIALLIKLDSKGPIFFLQKRSGQNNLLFSCIKFRTMIVNDEADIKPAVENDKRITPIGKFLRNYYLDELPQLWNILLGEMSYVGPRPIVEAEVEKYGASFELYKSVDSGLTGLWQVSGRNDTSYEERVTLDTFYARNWSVWLDMCILFRTIGAVLFRKGAY